MFASGAHQQLLSSQMLLDFTRSEREVVQERALGRIGVLTYLMSNYSSLKVRSRRPPARPSPLPATLHARAAAQLVAPRDGAIEPCKAQVHQESSPGHTLGYKSSAPTSFS